MSRWRSDVLGRSRRWLSTTAVIVLMPKCVLCLATYLGLGAVFGIRLAAPELCGAGGDVDWPASAWVTVTAVAAGVVIGGWLAFYRRQHRRFAG